jgi:hypothetical protein
MLLAILSGLTSVSILASRMIAESGSGRLTGDNSTPHAGQSLSLDLTAGGPKRSFQLTVNQSSSPGTQSMASVLTPKPPPAPFGISSARAAEIAVQAALRHTLSSLRRPTIAMLHPSRGRPLSPKRSATSGSR